MSDLQRRNQFLVRCMADVKYCPHCGKPIKATALKCIHCKQWVDKRQDRVTETEPPANAGSSSGISPVIGIIATLAIILIGTLIYFLIKDNNGGSDGFGVEKLKTDDSDNVREVPSYSSSSSNSNSSYSSSSSSSYSSSTYTLTCPRCDGTGRYGDDDCFMCFGAGELVADRNYGICTRGCGCDGFVAPQGQSSFCVVCMLNDCRADKYEHSH